MSKDNLTSALAYFTGTEHYYRYSPLFRNVLLTDGAKFLAEEAGAYWLMDMIASHRSNYQNESFVVAKFQKIVGGWELGLQDGNDHFLAAQRITYSDFPLDEITLYVIHDGANWVILLPSEY